MNKDNERKPQKTPQFTKGNSTLNRQTSEKKQNGTEQKI